MSKRRRAEGVRIPGFGTKESERTGFEKGDRTEDFSPEEMSAQTERSEDLAIESHAAAAADSLISDDMKAELQMDALDNAYTLQNAMDADISQKDHEAYTTAKQNLEVQKAELPGLRENINAQKGTGLARAFRSVFKSADLTRDEARLQRTYDSIKANAGIVNDHEGKIKDKLGIEPPVREEAPKREDEALVMTETGEIGE